MTPDLKAEILDVLNETMSEIDNYVDVVDGDDGQPAPNWAMSLTSRIEELMAKVEASE